MLDYDVTGFDGKKKIAFAQTNFLGGKNLFLAYCYIVVGALCILFAIVFIVTYKYTKKWLELLTKIIIKPKAKIF